MEELSKIASDIALHTNAAVVYLNNKLQDCYFKTGKSRAGSTPYASKRKKKHKRKKI